MIALITGYYKVYVDNTSNTPLPVENEEKWPFAFRRDPPANDGGYQNILSVKNIVYLKIYTNYWRQE